MLRGERPINHEMIDKMGSQLGLSITQIHSYKKKQIQMKYSISEEHLQEDVEYLQIEQDQFELIQDYLHYAILELIKIHKEEISVSCLAKSLKVSNVEIKSCIERLRRCGLLKIHQNGNWEDTSEGMSTHILGENYTSRAHRNSQKQILDMAQQALENTPIENRDQSSMMVATSQRKIQEAKRMITRFRRELCRFLEEDESEKDTVYQLSVSLFPITEKKKLTRR